MRDFFRFWCGCARIAARGSAPFANDWQWVFGNPTVTAILPGVIAGVAALPNTGWFDTSAEHPILGPLLIAFGAFIFTWLVAFFVRLIRAPVELNRQKSQRVIDLEKVGRDDLQRMLGGMFLDKTFMYGGDSTLCKKYQGNFEIGLLRNGFDMISVRAPKNSWASIRFQFQNRRQEPDKYAFHYLDGNGRQSRIENIYEHLNIYLDEQARFGLKLVSDAEYKIDEAASLWVGVESWTK
jgi:hypothetical protein